MVLTRYGRESTSVFDLLGHSEVDLTAALGWTLAHSPTLMARLSSRLGISTDVDDLDVALEVADDEGRTDLELRTGGALVIIEAKKGWLLPGETQLGKYVARFGDPPNGLIVSLSDSSGVWAARELPPHVNAIPVVHLPWDDVRTDLRSARMTARSAERLWLEQLITYLAGATAVRDPAEQWVYVVSISTAKPGDSGGFTFRDFVTTERAYFHPLGRNWLKRPPVLMGFRWNGKLQQVNRVVDSEIVPNLQTRWPDIRETPETARPHAVYKLGPDIPVPPLPSTGIVKARRVWALLDQLLTQPTIVAAEQESKKLTEPAD